MNLARRKRNMALITMTPLVDVMMILLVFFMVTSTYLDLDMMPMVQSESEGVAAPSGPAPTLLIRITASGEARLRGQPLTAQSLATALETQPHARVLILPSGGSNVQGLVSAIETATQAGAENLRVVRLEASE
ncbi:MAG: biopolymer transporter ExbD [Rhodobacteraceae bacterium]|nr:biopolymer transporter ExbD [Paracoccaceae bacterium]